MLAVVPALARAPRVGLLPQALRSLPEQRLDLRSQRVDVERGERRGDLAADVVLGESADGVAEARRARPAIRRARP